MSPAEQKRDNYLVLLCRDFFRKQNGKKRTTVRKTLDNRTYVCYTRFTKSNKCFIFIGAAGSKQLDTFGPKILKDDYAPGFFMKHFIKDMKLALIEANRKGLSLDVLSMVLANYEELEQEGYGDLGTQALMKFYDEEHRNTEE